MNREQIFRELYKEQVKRDEWFNKLPIDINAAFFDNAYVNSLADVNHMLVNNLFGEYADSVYWFLYEWKPGYEVGFDGKTTAINNIDEYIDWMKAVEGFH